MSVVAKKDGTKRILRRGTTQGALIGAYLDGATGLRDRAVRGRRVLALHGRIGCEMDLADVAAALSVDPSVVSRDVPAALAGLREAAETLGLSADDLFAKRSAHEEETDDAEAGTLGAE